MGIRTFGSVVVLATALSPNVLSAEGDLQIRDEVRGLVESGEFSLEHVQAMISQIEQTRFLAEQACAEAFQADDAAIDTAVGASDDDFDRDALIDAVENLGAPEGAAEALSDINLVRAADSMVDTNRALCLLEGYRKEKASLQAIQEGIKAGIYAVVD